MQKSAPGQEGGDQNAGVAHRPQKPPAQRDRADAVVKKADRDSLAGLFDQHVAQTRPRAVRPPDVVFQMQRLLSPIAMASSIKASVRGVSFRDFDPVAESRRHQVDLRRHPQQPVLQRLARIDGGDSNRESSGRIGPSTRRVCALHADRLAFHAIDPEHEEQQAAQHRQHDDQQDPGDDDVGSRLLQQQNPANRETTSARRRIATVHSRYCIDRCQLPLHIIAGWELSLTSPEACGH